MTRLLSLTYLLGLAAAAMFVMGVSSGTSVALTSMHSPLSVSAAQMAAPPAKKCPANLKAATVGGQSKCLAAGQQCQQAHASDYTHSGFTCTKVGNRFQLNAKPAGAKPAGAKPAPAKAAPAKAAPAKAHH